MSSWFSLGTEKYTRPEEGPKKLSPKEILEKEKEMKVRVKKLTRKISSASRDVRLSKAKLESQMATHLKAAEVLYKKKDRQRMDIQLNILTRMKIQKLRLEKYEQAYQDQLLRIPNISTQSDLDSIIRESTEITKLANLTSEDKLTMDSMREYNVEVSKLRCKEDMVNETISDLSYYDDEYLEVADEFDYDFEEEEEAEKDGLSSKKASKNRRQTSVVQTSEDIKKEFYLLIKEKNDLEVSSMLSVSSTRGKKLPSEVKQPEKDKEVGKVGGKIPSAVQINDINSKEELVLSEGKPNSQEQHQQDLAELEFRLLNLKYST